MDDRYETQDASVTRSGMEAKMTGWSPHGDTWKGRRFPLRLQSTVKAFM